MPDHEYKPPVTARDENSNLVYQDHQNTKGGSDSSSKLSALRLPNLTDKRFLDLGCNAGFFCQYAMDNGARYTLGIDNSDKIIAIAQERHPELDFRSGGWDKFPDGEFDIVICLSAIHYAKDSVSLAGNIRNCLSADGTFVLEGGLVGATGEFWSDTLIPSWREVGDKCRHLSRGFLQRHLLVDFDWKIINQSVTQGGDPIERFVIHAQPGPRTSEESRPTHRLCLLEYTRALALSAPTIHDQQPSHRYVRALGNRDINSDMLSAILADDENYSLYIKDLIYALNNYGTQLELRESVDGKRRANPQS